MAVSITRALITLLSILLLTGCAGNLNNKKWSEPTVARNPIQSQLDSTPHLDGDKITIAVYGFQDKTGQRKSNDKFSVLSSAVTQGSEVWVIDALKKVGGGTWFQVVERVSLDNLVKERQLIRSTREVYEGQKAPKLKPMLFAGIILEGAVVSYDSNIETGGQGARYLGIGVTKQYRVDQVTVSMRIVSVQTGEVLLSVATEKKIASYRTSADLFRFVDLGTVSQEAEIGNSLNEPVNYAVRAAIESSVVEIVKQGEEQGLWKYKKLASDKINEEKSKNENNN
jgi:curli production assembly/transport component CsgG